MLTIRLHGVLTRLAGTERLTLDLPKASTVGEVLQQVAERWPVLTAELRRSACAIGDELVARGERIAAGSELNLLPPVSGG